MKITVTRALIATLLSSNIMFAYSESPKSFKNVLEGFKKILDVSKGKAASNTPIKNSTEINLSKNEVEYCEKLKSNPIFTEFSNVVDEVISNKWVYHPTYYLDTSDRLVAQWLERTLKNHTNPDQDLKMIRGWVNACAYNNRNSETNIFYAIVPDARNHKKIKSEMEYFNNKNSEEKRVVDADGNITVLKPSNVKLKQFISGPSQAQYMFPQPHWAALYALALPNGEAVLKKLTSNIPSNIKKSAQEKYKKSQADIAKYEEKERIEHEELVVKDKPRKDKAKNLYEYLKTSDGQLLMTYTYYYRIKSCSDLRKDYAAIYVTNSQLENAKEQAKNIENKLKSSLVESVDILWNKAVESDDDYIFVGNEALEGTYLGIENYNFNTAKNHCSVYVKKLQSIADNILGKESVDKGF